MPGTDDRVSRFLSELRRRHVIRVAIAYAAVAWLVAQFADTVFPALDLPDWTITLVVLLLFLGFPIAVALAWAFDITPSGVERTPSETRPAAPSPAARARGPAEARPAGPPTRSIAALPFVNLSQDAKDDYFSDGLTEELINALTRVRGLHVAARTSAFAFKGSPLDVREIGRKLDVQHVLEGSVRTAGTKLRMGVQLIDVEHGYCSWSETFDRELGDVFAIQEEIARAVVDRLRIGPPGEANRHLIAPHTEDLEAYHHYLRGRYLWNRRTEADLRKSIEHFEQAISTDPGYALAHAGLADAYSILLDHGLLSPHEALPRALRAAERALSLDATLAEAHTSVAMARQFDWQWEQADASFREALRLNPAYAVAHHRYALFLAWMGRGAEAMDHIREAERLDPLSLIIGATIGWIHYYHRRYADAERQLRATLELEPNFANAHVAMALTLGRSGRTEEAIASLESAISAAGETPPMLALLTHALGAGGHDAPAAKALERLEERAATTYVPAYYRALPHLGLGEIRTSLEWLERAYDERSASTIYLNADPIWDPVRTEPRFRALIERMAFPAVALR